MNVTDAQIEGYMAGTLRLKVIEKDKTFEFLPTKLRLDDNGKTSPEKRAYWRVWRLRRRLIKLGVIDKDHKLVHWTKKVGKLSRIPVKTPTNESDTGLMDQKRGYLRAYRVKNRLKLNAKGREYYHKKHKTGKNPHKNVPNHTVTEVKQHYRPRRNWFQRILGNIAGI